MPFSISSAKISIIFESNNIASRFLPTKLARKYLHLSHHRWNPLCRKAFRHGGDYFYLSHFSPSSLPSPYSYPESRWGEMGEMKERNGREMGEMTGGIKMAESLYLKGFSPSDGRDWTIFDNNRSLSDNNARLFLDNAALFALIVPLLGTIYSHLGNIIFPAWEQNIPSVGI